MGLLSRISTVIKARINAILERAEDPRQTLDYSYQKQLELLRNVKRGVVDVVTSKRRLEIQVAKLKGDINTLDQQAHQALAAGREDLARAALQRKQTALQQIQGLDTQITALEQEQQKLTEAEQRLSVKVESFRTRKEVIKAQYSAAEAQVKIGEAVSGLSEEMADVGMAVQRAEEKTEGMRARATAIDQLVEVGVLEDFTGKEDRLSKELAQITTAQNVDGEMEKLKKELGAPAHPKALQEGKQ